MVAIGWFLVKQWPTLRNYPWRLHWGWFFATCIVTLASWSVEIAVWRHLLALLGGNLSYWTATRIWLLSAIVRYIPGNVWQPLSLTLYSRRHGVAPEASLTSIVLFQVIMLLATVPILVVYFVWIDTKSLAAQFVANVPSSLLWLALIPIIAFLLRPQWLMQLLNWALARMKRPPLAVQLTSTRLLALLVIGILNWLLWGMVFAAFTFAVAGAGLNGLGSDGSNLAVNAADAWAMTPLLIASYPIANVIGLLSFITPSGFGVREGAFYLLLTPQIAGSVVTVIALGVRVWGVVTEVLLALISLPFERAATARIAATEAPTDTVEARLSLPSDPPHAEPILASDLRRETT